MLFKRTKFRSGWYEEEQERVDSSERVNFWQTSAVEKIVDDQTSDNEGLSGQTWKLFATERKRPPEAISLTDAQVINSSVCVEEKAAVVEGGSLAQKQLCLKQFVETKNKEAEPTVRTYSKVPPCDLGVSVEDDLKRRFGGNIKSALGYGTVIEGTFRFDSPVCIDGTLLGEVDSSSVLVVGTQAKVKARVKVGSLVVLGTVVADVEAEQLVEIRAGGHLEGDITTRRLVIEEGAVFNGSCEMLD